MNTSPRRRTVASRLTLVGLGLLVLLFSSSGPVAAWQDEPPAPEAQEQAKQAFAELNSQWTAIEDNLKKLQEEFAEANQERRIKIREEFTVLVEQIGELAEPLEAAARAAYAADPNADERVIDVLLSAVMTDISEDRYGDAQGILQLLFDNQATAQGIDDLAGITAYAQNRFAEAKTRLERAKTDNAISAEGSRLLDSLPNVTAAWEAEEKLRAAPANQNLPQVKLETSKGDIVLELFENEAPNTVKNFVSLVEQGFYDGLSFHRVLPGFMAQGGCPIGNGTGGPGYKIPCECYEENHRNHFAGSLSMAHAGRDTGGSQFFLTFRPTLHLNGKHTVFGRVVDGWETLANLQVIDPSRPRGEDPDKILKATVLRKGEGDYTPEKID